MIICAPNNPYTTNVGHTLGCSSRLCHTHLFDPLVMLGLGWEHNGVQQEATSHSPVWPSGQAGIGLGTQWSAAGGYVTLTCLTLSSCWGGERWGEEGGVLLTTSAKLRVFPSMEEKLCTLSSSSVSSYSRLLRTSGVLSPSRLLWLALWKRAEPSSWMSVCLQTTCHSLIWSSVS